MKTGKSLRDGGIAGIARSHTEWIEAHVAMLSAWLRRRRRAGEACVFTFDTFRSHCEARSAPRPRHPNAWGALPHVARARGLCRPTNVTEVSARPGAHYRRIRVWVA